MKQEKEFTAADHEKPTIQGFQQIKFPGEKGFFDQGKKVEQLERAELERQQKDWENLQRHEAQMRDKIHAEEEIEKLKGDMALQDTADGGVNKTVDIPSVAVKEGRDVKRQSAISKARRQNWLKNLGKGLAVGSLFSWMGYLSWPHTEDVNKPSHQPRHSVESMDDVPRPNRSASQELEGNGVQDEQNEAKT